MITGTNDEIVPTHHSEKLIERAVNCKHKLLHRVKDGLHNDTWMKGGREYVYALKEFMEKAQEDKTPKNATTQGDMGATPAATSSVTRRQPASNESPSEY